MVVKDPLTVLVDGCHHVVVDRGKRRCCTVLILVDPAQALQRRFCPA